MTEGGRQFGRRLFVAWQQPQTRAIEPVAVLVGGPLGHGAGGAYRFGYLKRTLNLEGFEPFMAFPDLRAVYSSARLFPFFENRVVGRRRQDYGAVVASLGLSVDASPLDVLARSGGRRATDPLEVFAEPVRVSNDRGSCVFFVRGLRYVPGSEKAIEDLAEGDRLYPLLDIQNPVNPQALLLRDESQRLVGYLPDYLTAHVMESRMSCGSDGIQFTVERVNSTYGPRHERLLCRMDSCWPPGYRAFSDSEFDPISAELKHDIDAALEASERDFPVSEIFSQGMGPGLSRLS